MARDVGSKGILKLLQRARIQRGSFLESTLGRGFAAGPAGTILQSRYNASSNQGWPVKICCGMQIMDCCRFNTVGQSTQYSVPCKTDIKNGEVMEDTLLRDRG